MRSGSEERLRGNRLRPDEDLLTLRLGLFFYVVLEAKNSYCLLGSDYLLDFLLVLSLDLL